jgi:glucose-6-phosphate 1-dehydrogenase
MRSAGIEFAVTSGRPPRGMQMLIEPLTQDFPNYAAGTDGPAAGDELLARGGRAWRPLA